MEGSGGGGAFVMGWGRCETGEIAGKGGDEDGGRKCLGGCFSGRFSSLGDENVEMLGEALSIYHWVDVAVVVEIKMGGCWGMLRPCIFEWMLQWLRDKGWGDAGWRCQWLGRLGKRNGGE